jgi:6-dehydroglucose reductase
MSDLQDAPAIWGTMRARQGRDTANANGFARMLEACLDLGVHWIDHADIYDDGQVEILHGEAAQALAPGARAQLRLITKCGVRFAAPRQPGVRLHHYRSDAAYLTRQAETSLQRLGVERIDLYLLHRPDYLMQAEETAKAMEALVESGKVVRFGVSNFSTFQVDALTARTDLKLAANQVELSPFHTAPLDNGQLDQARATDMALLAWSPLGGRRFLDGEDETARRLRHTLEAMAARCGGEPGLDSLALAWLRTIGAIPILGTGRIDRLQRQVREMTALTLDAQDWYEILEAARGARVP